MLLPDTICLQFIREMMERNKSANPKGRNCCVRTIQMNKPVLVTTPGRSLRSTSFREGSLTLEAALTFPFFLMLLTAFLSFFSIMTMELKIQNAMQHAGKQLAAYYYVLDALKEDQEKQSLAQELGESLAVYAVSETVVKDRILEEAGEIPATVVYGGSGGLSFLGSRFDEASQDVVIDVSYRMVIPFLPPGLTGIRIAHQCRHRAWTGSNVDLEGQEQYVYVTENGTVYHTSVSCSYLKLSISQVSYNDVGSKRNRSGGKYYPCEYCGQNGGTYVFITEYGDRYHFNRNCSRLKRGIRCIPISEAGGLPLCSRCRSRGGG